MRHAAARTAAAAQLDAELRLILPPAYRRILCSAALSRLLGFVLSRGPAKSRRHRCLASHKPTRSPQLGVTRGWRLLCDPLLFDSCRHGRCNPSVAPTQQTHRSPRWSLRQAQWRLMGRCEGTSPQTDTPAWVDRPLSPARSPESCTGGPGSSARGGRTPSCGCHP